MNDCAQEDVLATATLQEDIHRGVMNNTNHVDVPTLKFSCLSCR